MPRAAKRTKEARAAPAGPVAGRVVAPEAAEEDRLDAALRPTRLDEFVGQKRVVENLRISVEAARKRGDAMDHVLLSGPPGLGKTTLAAILARELGVNMRATAGPVLERAGDLAGILTNLEPRDLLFIDEVHRIPRVVEEILYPAMEDFRIDIMLGKGPAARSVQLSLAPYTLVGATTRSGLLSEPLRARFGISHRLDHYAADEMTKIVTRSARLLGLPIDSGGTEEIARRSRGTPRVANRLLRRVRDYAEVRADGRITRETATAALEMLEVDVHGLDPMDRRLLEVLVDTFGGGPVGVENLAVALGEESGTIEEVYEPFLIQEGFLKRTARGRVALPRAFETLGRAPAAGPLFEEVKPA